MNNETEVIFAIFAAKNKAMANKRQLDKDVRVTVSTKVEISAMPLVGRDI